MTSAYDGRKLDLLDFVFPWGRLGSLYRALRRAECELACATRERDALQAQLAAIKAAMRQSSGQPQAAR